MRAFTFALTSLFVVTAAQACGASHDAVDLPAATDDASSSAATDASATDVVSSDANGGAETSALDAGGDTATDATTSDATSTPDATDASVDAPADVAIDAPVDAKADVACTPPKVSTASGCVTPLVLFRGGGGGGALGGGQSGADALCATARPALTNAPASSVAFISVDADDEIRDLPTNKGFATNVPIVGPTGKIVANDWANLLDGTIARSLSAAEVLSDADVFWYSGTDKSGAVTSKTCSAWTDGNTLFDASYGINSVTTEGWIHQPGEATCGLSSYSVLCIGY